MAITILASGDSGGSSAGSATRTSSITFSAGSGNRKLVIAAGWEVTSGTNDVSSLTINTQDLVALGLEVSGSRATSTVAGTVIFEQFEGGLPASGTQTITATFSSSTGDSFIAWWLIDGVDQGQTGVGGGAAAATTATALSATVTAGDTAAILLSAAYRNNSTTGTTMSAPTSSTVDSDLAGTAGGCRVNSGHKIGSLTAGSNTVTWTGTSTNRRTVSAATFNPAPITRNISGGFSLSHGATTDGAGVFVTHSVTGGFTQQPATTSGAVFPARNVSSGPTIGHATLHATGDLQVAVSGGFSLSHGATTAGSVGHVRVISGGFAQSHGATTGGTGVFVTHAISSGFSLSHGATTSGAVIPQREISGGFSLSHGATTAGLISTDNSLHITGGFTQQPVTTSGAVTVPLHVTGGFALSHGSTTSGSLDALLAITGGVSLSHGATTSGEVTHVRAISGGFSFGHLVLSNGVTIPLDISGAFALGHVLVAGGIIRFQAPASRGHGTVGVGIENSDTSSARGAMGASRTGSPVARAIIPGRTG